MKKIIFTIGLLFLLVINNSCNESILDETPLDFFSAENSYVTESDFQKALTDLYARVREICYAHTQLKPYLAPTDIAQSGRSELSEDALNSHTTFLLPTNGTITAHWQMWYKIVANTNTIISRAEDSELTESEKTVVVGEAKFFRAFAYRFLVYLWGGVPLITEEITAPRTDFTRVSKEEVLNQIAADAKDAANGLPPINEVEDGKISDIVAQHLLAETYISLGRYDEAVTAASAVINDPNVSLMTERFGSMGNEDPYDEFLKFTSPGDPFWDLFRRFNQVRSSGNNEALWVVKFSTDVVGGNQYSSGTRTVASGVLERVAAPYGPYQAVFTDPDGNVASLTTAQSNYNCGGAGCSYMMNTDYFLYTLWEDDWDNDIRNAPHNIVRDFVYDNPASAYYGLSMLEYPSPGWLGNKWWWYPYPSKVTTPGQHPDDAFLDKEKGWLKRGTGTLYRDHYMLRLPETYLLRAEALLYKNDLQGAADDINVVRQRANANPVSPADVTLDYILDERARELVYEEHRRITLHRTGKLVERVRKYSDRNNDEIQDHHALWPIPYSEIEANKDAILEQNPGYN